MRAFRYTGVSLGAAGAVVLLLTGARMSAAPGQTPDYWPLKVGSTWTVTTTAQNKSMDQVITVSDVKPDKGGSVATLQYTSGGKTVQIEKYSVTPQGIARLASGPDGSGTISPGLPIIKYPMKAGTTWNWKGDINFNGTNCKGTSTLTVSGPTNVKTPAGTFPCMKVHSQLTLSAQGQTFVAPNDYWFAPNVGIVQQHIQLGALNINGVLKSYKLK